ncbi:hypothetical protein H1P_2420004 [Hyella patelloides LEGE 07179]|uniref:Uncharacterized protein n=1 Tax=Hyella patelloides LEGE 07179 TaxID=945734 RepID=A0A563VRW1_9CYAN|nr:hypothetical protein [Hyella patelloides]VEP14122.1 hypothetical protein H1P_2420004 [Hyella patelloides LEGE 07179]
MDTPSRQRLLQDLAIASVPILYSGKPKKYNELTSLIGHSNYIKLGHIERFQAVFEGFFQGKMPSKDIFDYTETK